MERAASQQADTAAKLWEEYQLNSSVDNKNRLVMHYIFLVNSIVNRMMPLYGPHMCYDDLVGYGVLGLIDAVEKFAPERGIRFEIYAAKRIKGEVIDNIRQQDWASASLRSRIKQIGQAYEELEGRQEGTVSEDEVASRLGLDVGQVRGALEKAYIFNMVRFESLVSGVNDTGSVTLEETLSGDVKDMPEEQLTQRELSEVLAQSITRLSPNERKIISLYYYEELMLKDIAAILNVTPARVSQIHSRALLKIRMDIEKYYNITD